ncbi:hypothetical protein KUTeg_015989 [Tegillarca granosa]|uniref:UDP-glucose 4-epimerase n=1 Tax=Tegillarca granosa TaxID=220873 RepID=A0ABQ9EKR5_TEGGR|nr:hypothetical protein KUTeg_015989 [Tegillarca granosa]
MIKKFKMATKFVLVTGGAGFVGSHCVVELISAGYTVVVVDNLVNASMESIRRVEKITSQKITTYSVDLLDKQALSDVFTKHKFCCVIHFAGLKAVGESCQLPLLYYKTNIGGTINLLEVMKENGLRELIFSSSATVYGTPEYLPLDENHPVGGCTNPYGKTKYFIEHILMDLCKAEPEWNVIILRYFNPVGAHKSGTIGEDPQGPPNNLMPYISQVAIGKREKLSVFGCDYDTVDGTEMLICHIVGCKLCILKVSTSTIERVYNLGTGKGYSVLEMVKAFEKASGKPVPYQLVDRRAGDVASCYSKADLAEKELGWKATRGLQEMCMCYMHAKILGDGSLQIQTDSAVERKIDDS